MGSNTRLAVQGEYSWTKKELYLMIEYIFYRKIRREKWGD